MIAVGNVEGLREGKQHEMQEEKNSGEMDHGGPSRVVADGGKLGGQQRRI